LAELLLSDVTIYFQCHTHNTSFSLLLNLLCYSAMLPLYSSKFGSIETDVVKFHICRSLYNLGYDDLRNHKLLHYFPNYLSWLNVLQ